MVSHNTLELIPGDNVFSMIITDADVTFISEMRILLINILSAKSILRKDKTKYSILVFAFMLQC